MLVILMFQIYFLSNWHIDLLLYCVDISNVMFSKHQLYSRSFGCRLWGFHIHIISLVVILNLKSRSSDFFSTEIEEPTDFECKPWRQKCLWVMFSRVVSSALSLLVQKCFVFLRNLFIGTDCRRKKFIFSQSGNFSWIKS